MAPKRAKVVRTTKKVVEETIEVLGVASHDSVDLPGASDSKMVEVLVEAKEGEVPITVVVAKDKKDEPEPEHKQRADEASSETEQPPQKRDGDAELVSEQRAKEKKIEPGTEKKKSANEASPETKKPLPKQKGEDDDHSKRKEAIKSIADVETQEEEEEEEGEEEREEKDEEDVRMEKEAEPPTPKKVEKRKEISMKKSKKGGKQRRRRRKRRFAGGELDGAGGGYKRYVFRVLRQVHPGMGISARAMAVMDGMMGDMFERLADEASRLSTYARKATLSSREVQGAVQLVLPGELGKHAIAEGSKAVANYMAAASGGGD